MDKFTTADLSAPERFRIVEGGEYIYCGHHPINCRGHRYRALRFIIAVPAYQQLILVEALTGPDTGLMFACTPNNFSLNYVEAPPAPKPSAEEPAPEADTATVVRLASEPLADQEDSIVHPCGCISYKGSEGFERQMCQKHLGKLSRYPLYTKGA